VFSDADSVVADVDAAAVQTDVAAETEAAQADSQVVNQCDGINTNCFPAGTLVATSTGPVAIEAIRIGNDVWAYDLVASQWRLCRVLQTFVHDHEGTSAFITVQGETIESTSGHPFWVVTGTDLATRRCPEHIVAPQGAMTVGRWVEAGDVRIGDELLLRDGRIVSVEAVRKEAFKDKVYNFSVAELESYAVGVNNVLVHNTPDCFTDLEDQQSASFVHDQYVQDVLDDPVQREFETPWSSDSGLGNRRYDNFDDTTGTAFEGNTTPWSDMTQEQLSRKLDQVGSDIAILAEDNEVNQVIWFGTEELPTTGLGAQLREALQQANIPYWVVPKP
jgi:hypothetical protein